MFDFNKEISSFDIKSLTKNYSNMTKKFDANYVLSFRNAVKDLKVKFWFKYFDEIDEETFLKSDKNFMYYVEQFLRTNEDFKHANNQTILNDLLLISEKEEYINSLMSLRQKILLNFNYEMDSIYKNYEKNIVEVKVRIQEMEDLFDEWINQINKKFNDWKDSYLSLQLDVIKTKLHSSKLWKKSKLFDEKDNFKLEKLAQYLALTNQRQPIKAFSNVITIPLFLQNSNKLMV